MAKRDIRFSREAATIEHHSARGKVLRNSGNFTRGSQLISHEMMMVWAGVRMPLIVVFLTFSILLSIILNFRMQDHDSQLVLMRLFSAIWTYIGLDPRKIINLTLPDDSILRIPMFAVPYVPSVQQACAVAIRCVLAALLGSLFLSVPLTIWFVSISRKRGENILKERHERGAMLVERDVLIDEIRAHNLREFRKDCEAFKPPLDPVKVAGLPIRRRVDLGIHVPYTIASVPFPHRLEQSHAMLIGTTGAGKTTVLRKIVKQMRARGHTGVIFDLTGAFVEAFYNPETDTILNPMDNGHRYIREQADGTLSGAGWSLAPLIALIDALELVDGQERDLRRLHVELPRAITEATRKIFALIAPFAEDDYEWAHTIVAQLAEIRANRDANRKGPPEALQSILNAAESLLIHTRMVTTAFDKGDLFEKSSSRVDRLVHHQDTDPESPSLKVTRLPRQRSGDGDCPAPGRKEDDSSEDRHGIERSGFTWAEAPALFPWLEMIGALDGPNARAWSYQLARLLHVSDAAVSQAQRQMGDDCAAIALMITGQHLANGEIRATPESYFRGMIARDRRGELNIGHTLFGRRQAIGSLRPERAKGKRVSVPA
nr:replication initiation protein RepC [Sphingomonas populi]